MYLISIWNEGKFLYLPEKQRGFKIFARSGAFLFFSFSNIQCKAAVTLKHGFGDSDSASFPVVIPKEQLKTVKAKENFKNTEGNNAMV